MSFILHPNSGLYEKYSEIIDQEISKRRMRWKLSLAEMDYSDISQILRLHCLKKIHLFDDKKAAFSHWINRLLSNQIKNLVRNKYGAYSKVCLKCPHNGGGDVCLLYGKQGNVCKDYAKWENGKRYKLEISNPASIDSKIPTGENDGICHEILDKKADFIDFTRIIPEFNELMHKKLNALEWKVYDYLYISNLSDRDAATKLGYVVSNNKSSGYKQISKLKIRIYQKAKRVVEELNFH